MALDLPHPSVPGLDEYGVLNLEELQGQGLDTTIHATVDAKNQWIHPLWHGTTVDGVPLDYRPPPRFIYAGDEILAIHITQDRLEALDQGYAVYSYTVQPDQVFDYGHEESRRVVLLIGHRHFPGAGLNVATIKEAHELQFNHEDIPGSGAQAAVPPWQAMHAGDQVTAIWRGYRDSGDLIGEQQLVHEVEAHEVGLPITFQIPRSAISLARNGRGLLHYAIDYAGGGRTESPVQTFIMRRAPTNRLPALTLLGYSGGPLDPGLVSDGLTFSIDAYAQLHEGDSLIISAEDASSGVTEFITGLRLDRSSVDSGLLHASVRGNWLEDYLDRDVRLAYHVARPGVGLSGEPLSVPVRTTMKLPWPVVDGASGEGQGQGEFKASATADGIRIRVPSAAIYPQGAQVQMHWEGFPGAGSLVVSQSNGAIRPTFVISPSVVAPNLDKWVKVFYRVTANGDAPRDSAVFDLHVLPIAAHEYPTLQCLDAVNGELRVANLPSTGAALTVAPWPLIGLGQRITITATGTLRSGLIETNEFYKNQLVTSTTSPVSVYLAKTWLNGLAPNSEIELTVSVTADDGASDTIFPRIYIKILAV